MAYIVRKSYDKIILVEILWNTLFLLSRLWAVICFHNNMKLFLCLTRTTAYLVIMQSYYLQLLGPLPTLLPGTLNINMLVLIPSRSHIWTSWYVITAPGIRNCVQTIPTSFFLFTSLWLTSSTNQTSFNFRFWFSSLSVGRLYANFVQTKTIIWKRKMYYYPFTISHNLLTLVILIQN